MHAHKYIHTHIHVHVHTCIRKDVYTMYKRAYVHVYIVHVCVYVCIREYGSTLYVGMARKKHGHLYISIASGELKSLVIYTDKF